MIDEILLRRKGLLLFEDNETTSKPLKKNAQIMVLTINKNIESLGYILSEQAITELQKYSAKELTCFSKELIETLKSYVGADVEYKPMYPNFPKSIMSMGEYQLYLNAVIHYLTNGKILPYEVAEERVPLIERTDLKVIDLGSERDLSDIIANLLRSKTSISDQDKEDIQWFFENKNASYILPKEIPLKENCALIGKLYLKHCKNAQTKDLKPYFNTATDVLRLAVAISDGDISLKERTRFVNMNKKTIRIILELLNSCGNISEDMKKYKGMWIKLGEKLHPNKYQQFENVIKSFDLIRNNKTIETWRGKLNQHYQLGEYDQVINLLSQRSGEFARELDNILRKADDKMKVINSFSHVAGSVSTPVLWQVMNHFQHRDEQRYVMPKGGTSSLYKLDKEVQYIEKKYCDMVVNICTGALIQNYRQKDYMGNIYLSEEFKDYILPFNQRSASKSLKTLTTGSKVRVSESCKALRGFIWWTNNGDDEGCRVDIDLSATLLDEDFRYVSHISFSNLKDSLGNTHSGDIANGGDLNGKGVAEFIDINIDSCLTNNVRYVAFGVYSYTETLYSDMPNIKFGYMEREKPNDGEIFEPSTVKQRIDLSTKSTTSLPMVFDLVERKMIWLDVSISLESLNQSYTNTLESNFASSKEVLKIMTDFKKPSLYDLIKVNGTARGVFVDDKEDADIVFDLEDGITPYDTEIFMGEYL